MSRRDEKRGVKVRSSVAPVEIFDPRRELERFALLVQGVRRRLRISAAEPALEPLPLPLRALVLQGRKAQRARLRSTPELRTPEALAELLTCAEHNRARQFEVAAALAQTVLLILAELGPVRLGLTVFSDLAARGLLVAAECLRVREAFDAADEAVRATLLLSRQGSRNRALRNEALRKLGRLLEARREFRRANRLLLSLAHLHEVTEKRHRLAGELREAAQERLLLARTLISLGTAQRMAGCAEGALKCYYQAIPRLDPSHDLVELAIATLNAGWVELEQGASTKAAEILEVFRGLPPAQLPSSLTMSGAWLEARLCSERGNLARAETLYRELVEGYALSGRSLVWAQVSLELALTLARQGRPEASGAPAFLLVERLSEVGAGDRLRSTLIDLCQAASGGAPTEPHISAAFKILWSARPGLFSR